MPVTARPTIVFFIFAFAVLLGDALDGRPLLIDNDDLIRFLQIRDLVQDNALFDLRLPFISMPEAYVSHYSRIVDLPYYLLAAALQPLLGLEQSVTVASWLIPPVLLVPFCLLALQVARRLGGGSLGWLEAGVTALAVTGAILEFSPQRIDHHNVQIVLMMAMMAAMIAPTVPGGIMAGTSAAISVAVGLECLPLVAAGLAGLALAAVFDVDDARRKLQVAGLSLAIAAAPVALVSFGPSVLWTTYCDTVSEPWLLALIVGGGLCAVVPMAWRIPQFKGAGRGTAWRMASLSIPGLVLVVALAKAYPECAIGHYEVVDALSRRLWLDTIGQEKTILYQFATGRWAHLFFTILWAFLLIVTVPAIVQTVRAGQYAPAIIHGMALTAFVVFLMLERSTRISSTLIGILIPLALTALRGDAVRGERPRSANWWLGGSLAVPAVVAGTAYLAVPKTPLVFTVADQLFVDGCKPFDTSVLNEVAPSRIMAPFGVAANIMRNYPQHAVATFTLHRAAPGMHRMFVAFTSNDPTARAEALAPFDYLAVCARDVGFPGMDDFPLFAALVHGESVPGLIPVEPERDSTFKLYRIDHSAMH